MASSDELLNECLRQLNPSKGKEEEEEPSRKDKPLRGMQFVEVAHIKKSYQWLEKTGLKEALVMTPQ